MTAADLDSVAGGLARQAQWRERKQEEIELAQSVTAVVAGLQREQIGPQLIQMAVELAKRASEAEVEVTTALERKQTAETAQILHKMARLELGESTANVAHASPQDHQAQRVELEARLAALRGTEDADTQG